MASKTQEQMIQEIYESVTTLTTVLLGVPGTDETGLVGEVKQVKYNAKVQWENYNRLSTSVWLLWGIVLAVAVIASGIVTLANGGWR